MTKKSKPTPLLDKYAVPILKRMTSAIRWLTLKLREHRKKHKQD
jgi:hypothetical protein